MNEREYRQMYDVEETHWWYVALHRLIQRYVAREHSRKGALAILDAGCGTGRLCQLMQQFGRVSGFDSSAEALGFCKKRGLADLFRADLNDVELGENRYDIITSIDVLYHRGIEDETRIAAKFLQALKPGGLLILNLVAFEALRSSHDIAVHTRKRYTRGELTRMLTDCGFVIEKATYRLGLLFLPILCYRMAKKITTRRTGDSETASDVTPPSPLLNRLLLRLTGIENRVLETVDIPFGTSVFILARRPGSDRLSA